MMPLHGPQSLACPIANAPHGRIFDDTLAHATYERPCLPRRRRPRNFPPSPSPPPRRARPPAPAPPASSACPPPRKRSRAKLSPPRVQVQDAPRRAQGAAPEVHQARQREQEIHVPRRERLVQGWRQGGDRGVQADEQGEEVHPGARG